MTRAIIRRPLRCLKQILAIGAGRRPNLDTAHTGLQLPASRSEARHGRTGPFWCDSDSGWLKMVCRRLREWPGILMEALVPEWGKGRDSALRKLRSARKRCLNTVFLRVFHGRNMGADVWFHLWYVRFTNGQATTGTISALSFTDAPFPAATGRVPSVRLLSQRSAMEAPEVVSGRLITNARPGIDRGG